MQFEPDELELLDEEEEVEIESAATPGSEAHRTTLWIVVMGPHAYVRSVNGAQGHWYRRLMTDGIGTLHASDRQIPIRAAPVSDRQLQLQVSEAYRRKYALYPHDLAWITADPAGATTLRLERHAAGRMQGAS